MFKFSFRVAAVSDTARLVCIVLVLESGTELTGAGIFKKIDELGVELDLDTRYSSQERNSGIVHCRVFLVDPAYSSTGKVDDRNYLFSSLSSDLHTEMFESLNNFWRTAVKLLKFRIHLKGMAADDSYSFRTLFIVPAVQDGSKIRRWEGAAVI